MTPQGAAMIQVIDMPSGLGPVAPPSGRRPGGINILGAVLRRWWLVLLVTIIVSVVSFIATQKFMKAKYEAYAEVKWGIVGAGDGNSEFDRQVLQACKLLSSDPEIVLIVARDPEVQDALPWLRELDFEKPADQHRALERLDGLVNADVDHKAATVEIYGEFDDGPTITAIVNGFARALVEYCSKKSASLDKDMRDALNTQCTIVQSEISELTQKRMKLVTDNNLLIKKDTQADTARGIAGVMQEKRVAETAVIQLRLSIESMKKGEPPAALKLNRLKLIDEEKAKDAQLQFLRESLRRHQDALSAKLAEGATDQHPQVRLLRKNVADAESAIAEHEVKVAARVDAYVKNIQDLTEIASLQDAEKKLQFQESLLERLKADLDKINEDERALAGVRLTVEQLESRIDLLKDQHKDAWRNYQDFLRKGIEKDKLMISVARRADVPRLPSEDKRNKVRIAGCVGGLFLGVLLALLIDRLDKRLRDPRDVEVLLNAPLLGTIPRIGELKRIKGEQARNLIAEEFRMIRTQILFGNPHLQYKSMCVSSPAPGDGKTSLAVNLAISIAKAGRRTLLVDADMRKPDVHRIFNIPEAPGLAELIQGTCEPGAAIRKTDIEFLDVLPSGLPIVRPAELLSRPEMGRLLGALTELYDHVVFDSAPLLPVSDSHVLCGMVAGVVVSLNAQVDYDTVRQVEAILRRNHATLIGSVVNQVNYKQSNSYHRGKSVYDSYYTSTRGAAGDAAKTTTLAKGEK